MTTLEKVVFVVRRVLFSFYTLLFIVPIKLTWIAFLFFVGLVLFALRKILKLLMFLLFCKWTWVIAVIAGIVLGLWL